MRQNRCLTVKCTLVQFSGITITSPYLECIKNHKIVVLGSSCNFCTRRSTRRCMAGWRKGSLRPRPRLRRLRWDHPASIMIILTSWSTWHNDHPEPWWLFLICNRARTSWQRPSWSGRTGWSMTPWLRWDSWSDCRGDSWQEWHQWQLAGVTEVTVGRSDRSDNLQ